jgi:glycosyltransferase involved in cell wall biosynthesis
MEICTIIAKNYLAHARVLARSLAERQPDARLSVLVIDEIDGFIDPAEEAFRVLTVPEIGCEPFPEMSARYSVLELSTAVKPWLLRFLLGEGSQAVTYLDPDIRVYGPLTRLDELAREHGLVLTPHNTTPIPDDGELPTQLSVLVSGVYNLGYVSVGDGPATRALLDWWAGRLEHFCRVDPRQGYFVDQRWFDLAPGFVPSVAIVRDPEFNVAYWNLQSRGFTRSASGYEIDGRPLGFFHFSGFDPRTPHVLSRFQTRIKLSEQPAVAEICREYADEVAGQGFAESSRWPYSFGALPDGTPFTPPLRELYVRALDDGAIVDSPFTAGGFEQLLRWLAQPAAGAPNGFTRLHAHAYSERAELRSAFPDVSGGDRLPFLAFAAATTDYDLGLVARLAQYANAQGSEPEPTASAVGSESPVLWGVNVVGCFHSDLTPGLAARAVVAALDSAEIAVLPGHARAAALEHERHPFACLSPPEAELAVNLLCVEPDDLPALASALGPSFFAGRHSIGLWLSQENRFPERLQRSFELLDEVWVPSHYLADALGPRSPIPVHAVTVPILAEPIPPLSRAQLGLPDGFLFLASIDHAGLFEQRNPLALVEAFRSAFAPGEGAVLVITAINERSDLPNHELLRIAAAAHPDVHVIDGHRERAQQLALVAACDCFVSLHRSVGFGLGIAEAMQLGKPAIATGYSGNLDFMTPANSLLVDYTLVPVGNRGTPQPADDRWAAPDGAHAAQLMRRVFDNPELGREVGERGAADLRRTHSAAVAGALIAERLAPIRAEWGSRAKETAQLGSASMTSEQDEQPSGSRRSPRALARGAVLRAIKPYTARQDAVNASVNRKLARLQPELMRLDRRQDALEAELEARAPSALDARRSAPRDGD